MFILSTKIIQQSLRLPTTQVVRRQISRYAPLLSDHNQSDNVAAKSKAEQVATLHDNMLSIFNTGCNTIKTTELGNFATDCDTIKTTKLGNFATDCDTIKTTELGNFATDCDTTKKTKLGVFAEELQRECSALVDTATERPTTVLRHELVPRIKNTETHTHKLNEDMERLKKIGKAFGLLFFMYTLYYAYRFYTQKPTETRSLFDFFAPKSIVERVNKLEELVTENRIDLLERRIHDNWASSYWTYLFSSRKDVDQYNVDINEKSELEKTLVHLRNR